MSYKNSSNHIPVRFVCTLQRCRLNLVCFAAVSVSCMFKIKTRPQGLMIYFCSCGNFSKKAAAFAHPVSASRTKCCKSSWWLEELWPAEAEGWIDPSEALLLVPEGTKTLIWKVQKLNDETSSTMFIWGASLVCGSWMETEVLVQPRRGSILCSD